MTLCDTTYTDLDKIENENKLIKKGILKIQDKIEISNTQYPSYTLYKFHKYITLKDFIKLYSIFLPLQNNNFNPISGILKP